MVREQVFKKSPYSVKLKQKLKLKRIFRAKFRCCRKCPLFPSPFLPLPKKYPTKRAGKNLGTSSFGRREEGRRMVFGKRGGGKKRGTEICFPTKIHNVFSPPEFLMEKLEELIKRSPFVLWKQKKEGWLLRVRKNEKVTSWIKVGQKKLSLSNPRFPTKGVGSRENSEGSNIYTGDGLEG